MAYAFPLLQVDEIVAFVRIEELFNVPVDPVDFTKPDPRRWRDIYTCFVEILTGVPFDPNLPALVPDTCDHPELYNEAYQEIWFVMVMQRVLRSTGIIDFNLKDVRSPSKTRLVKVCSAVINFFKFSLNRCPFYTELKEEHERSRERYDYFLRINEDLKCQGEKLKEEKQQQEPELAKINQDIEVISQKMQELVKVKEAKEKTLQELKTNIAEKAAAIDQEKHAMCKSKEEMEKLSHMIVQSPEKLKKEREKMKLQLNQLREDMEQKREKMDDIRLKLKKIGQHQTNIDSAFKMVNSIQEEIDKENEIAKGIAELKEKTADGRGVMRDLQSKNNQNQHLESAKHERLAKLTLQHQSKMKSLQETIQGLKMEENSLKEAQTQEEAKKRELSEQKRRLLDQLDERLKLADEKIEERKDMYSQLLQLMDQYHSQLAEKFEELKEVMQ